MAQNYQISTEFRLIDKTSHTLDALGVKGNFLRERLGIGLMDAERRLRTIGVMAGFSCRFF